MRITIEPTEGPLDFAGSDAPEFQHPKSIIELADDDLNLNEVVEYLVKPALKGFGFGEKMTDAIDCPEPKEFYRFDHG